MRNGTAWAIGYFLISQLWILGSWINPDPVGSLMRLFMGFVFLLAFVFAMSLDRKEIDMNFRVRRAERELEHKKFELIISLLGDIKREAGKDWKRFIKEEKNATIGKKKQRKRN